MNNNKFDEIDDLFFSYFKQNNNVPDVVSNTIKTINLKKQLSKTRLIIKNMIATIVAIISITGGVVLAGVFINSIFNYNKGIEKAVENNYIQNINMDYISTENLEFKVEHFVMDDINFSLVFEFRTKDNIQNYQGIAPHNLKISDDLGNQILYDTEGDDFYKNVALLHSSWEIIEKGENYIKQVLKAQSNNFPCSNKLFVSFDGITLYKVEDGVTTTEIYNGDWSFSFDVSDQLKDRKVEYFLGDNINIKEVKLSNSGLVMKVKSKDYIENLHLYDDKGNEYKLILNIQNRDADLMKYIEDEWIIFFDASIYNDIDYLKLNMHHTEYILRKS